MGGSHVRRTMCINDACYNEVSRNSPFCPCGFNCLNYGYCEALRFATSLRTDMLTLVPTAPMYCEALRFATSLRNDRLKTALGADDIIAKLYASQLH